MATYKKLIITKILLQLCYSGFVFSQNNNSHLSSKYRCGTLDDLIFSRLFSTTAICDSAWLAQWGYSASCNCPTTRDSFIPTNFTPSKYFSLLIVVVDSNLYGVIQKDIDSMMADVNNYFSPWKIQFCYTTDFIDSASMSFYPKNSDSIINVLIYDWPNLGLSGNPIKIDYSVIVNNNYKGGLTLAHELGHDFQLLHNFNSLMGPPWQPFTCSYVYRDRVDYMPFPSIEDTVGDWLSDTPPTPINNNCAPPTGVDTCSVGNPSWPNWGYENIMGYAFCTNATFTPQQAGRMHCFIDHGNLPNNILKYESLLAYGMLYCAPLTSIGNVNAENKLLEIMPNPFTKPLCTESA